MSDSDWEALGRHRRATRDRDASLERRPVVPDLGPLRLPARRKTYRADKTLTTTRPVPEAHMVAICEQISAALCVHYRRPAGSFRVQPEPISEGGIEWLEWPGKEGNQYKSIRFRNGFGRNTRWPTVERATVMESWRDSPEVALSGSVGIYLKAFDGAPGWSKSEVALFLRIFADFGIVPSRVARRHRRLHGSQ